MFAVIHLPQFTLQAALRHEPELWTQPVALVDPSLPTPRVGEVTEAAQALGVTAGLTPTQALARCREIVIRRRSPGQESAATDALLQCAYKFSPNLENTSPGTVTLDLRGLVELTGGQTHGRRDGGSSEAAEPCLAFQAWAERLRADLASLNLRARIGIGPTPNVARHAARWPQRGRSPREKAHSAPSDVRDVSSKTNQSLLTGPCEKHPNTPRSSFSSSSSSSNISAKRRTRTTTRTSRLEPIFTRPVTPAATIVLDATAFIASLPVVALEPSSDVALILRKWGVRTVGELLALGQEALVERLGLEALALFAAASTTAARPLNLVRPAERYEESFDFEQEIETIDPLLFVLRRFVDGLSQRLELSGLVAALLTLKLRLESGEVLERRLRLPQPTRKADVLFRMLHTHLESLRADSPIVSVALQADPRQPEQEQFGLFEAALRDPHQFQETLARLSALVGADRVGTPVRENSHRPDAFKLVPPDFENTPDAGGRRVAEILRATPLRRIRPAMKAIVETAKVAPHTSPLVESAAVSHRTAPRRPTPATDPADVANMLEVLVGRPTGVAAPPRPGPAPGPRPDNIIELPAPSRRRPASGEGEEHAPAEPELRAPDRKSPRPLSVQCKLARGTLSVAVGPWRVSGNWWDANAWQREEWDVQTREGKVLRLAQRADGWFVEGVLD